MLTGNVFAGRSCPCRFRLSFARFKPNAPKHQMYPNVTSSHAARIKKRETCLYKVYTQVACVSAKKKKQVSLFSPFGSTFNCPKSQENKFQLRTPPTSNFCGSYLSKLIRRTKTLFGSYTLSHAQANSHPPNPNAQSQQRKLILKSWFNQRVGL